MFTNNCFPVYDPFMNFCTTFFCCLLILFVIITSYKLSYTVANYIITKLMWIQDKKTIVTKTSLNDNFIEEENLILTKIFQKNN